MSNTHPLVIKALKRNFKCYDSLEDAIVEIKGWSNSALRELFAQIGGAVINEKQIMINTLEEMLKENWECLKS